MLLSLGDGCLDPETARVDLSLLLSGDEDRPVALRTTLLFDPTLLAPEAEPVTVGDALRSWGTVRLSAESSVPGRLDLVVQREGAWPLTPLPEGMLLRLRFRALGEIATRGGTLVQMDRAETVATTAENAPSLPEVAGPVPIHRPTETTPLSVGPAAGGTRIEPQGGGGQRLVVRGRLEDLRPMGDRVLIPEVDRLGLAGPGRPLLDPESPAVHQAFFYLTMHPAAEEGTGLGFASDCRPRMLPVSGD